MHKYTHWKHPYVDDFPVMQSLNFVDSGVTECFMFPADFMTVLPSSSFLAILSQLDQLRVIAKVLTCPLITMYTLENHVVY